MIKVGDRVKVKDFKPLLGQEGEVFEVDPYPSEELPIYVYFHHLKRGEFFEVHELEVIP